MTLASLSPCPPLLRFGVGQVLSSLKRCTSSSRSARLTHRLVDVVRGMAGLLATALQAEGRTCLEEGEAQDVFLPDRGGRLYPVRELCLNDGVWLQESDAMHCLHPKFSESLAHVFGVRTKREHDEVSGFSFGA